MTNSHNLNVQRLQAVVDAFGANPERWPAAEQSALEVLATGDQAARDIVGEGWPHTSRHLDNLRFSECRVQRISKTQKLKS